MSKIFFWLYRFNRRRSHARLDLLCAHMVNIYNYFYSVNSGQPTDAYVNEALSTLHGWKKQSAHIFKHSASKSSIEVKPNARLIDITIEIYKKELPTWLYFSDRDMEAMILRDGLAFINDYFVIYPPFGNQDNS